MDICTHEWWQRVVAAWNQYAGAAALADFGTARFEVSDADLPPVFIEWGAKGQGEMLDEPFGKYIVFGATYENWRAFVAGRFTAMEGALTGRIKVTGNTLAVLPYTGGFTQLAAVARTVNAGEVRSDITEPS